MSMTLAMLQLLSDGRPRTVAQMAVDMDLTIDQVHDVLQSLRKLKCTTALGTPYTITPVGRDNLSRREAVMARVAARRKAKEARKAAPPAMAPVREVPVVPVESIVAQALERRHALHSIWG